MRFSALVAVLIGSGHFNESSMPAGAILAGSITVILKPAHNSRIATFQH